MGFPAGYPPFSVCRSCLQAVREFRVFLVGVVLVTTAC